MTLPPLFCESFPSFIKQNIDNCTTVFWYHPDFSQSRYPSGQKKSEACTLICLLLAQRISETKLKISRVDKCSELNILMAEAIIAGNKMHAWILNKGIISHPYLNTVEALMYGGNNLNNLKEWKFRVIHEKIEIGLSKNIKFFLQDWYKHPRSENLFMLLITCGRTILFIFQNQINKTRIDNLETLCHWYIKTILHGCYNALSNHYELAFLYERKKEKRSCNCHSSNL